MNIFNIYKIVMCTSNCIGS